MPNSDYSDWISLQLELDNLSCDQEPFGHLGFILHGKLSTVAHTLHDSLPPANISGTFNYKNTHGKCPALIGCSSA